MAPFFIARPLRGILDRRQLLRCGFLKNGHRLKRNIMVRIAYQASHEQFAPSHLLCLARMAEEAGFDAIHSSDHFHPWNRQQGQCGFSFAWLGAAMQQSKLPFGMVCAPGQRYHPAVVAQAIATLSEMFPGRFHVSLASGEALNESITGDKWPPYEERKLRLRECVDIIRHLLSGEKVSHAGRVRVENARLYTLPAIQPQLFGAALSPESAHWVGAWADGLVTVCQNPGQLKQVVDAFKAGGGEGKPVHAKIDLSYALDEEEALRGAHEQWRTNIFGRDIITDTAQVEQFEAIAEYVRPEDMRRSVLVSADLQVFVQRIREVAALGVEAVILHNVNRGQERFIEDFGREVLPHVPG
jgi:coenzyme F420-dependent glucose-6-phosphate dehydrogenase